MDNDGAKCSSLCRACEKFLKYLKQLKLPKSAQTDQMDMEVDKPENKVGAGGIPVLVPPIVQCDIDSEKNDNKNVAFLAPSPAAAPAAKSFLGADLLPKPASLAMPPPTSTTVKKTKRLVQPGMSMVKWMKLQENKPRPVTRRKIPLSEIQRHNTESDCWMVIRNSVYDVTEYIPYHPGGVEELMKGAGKDATSLFNEVHRWVNYDSILRSCFKGYLLVELGESFDESQEVAGGNVLDNRLIVPKKSSVVPRAEFSQNDSLLIFQVDTMMDDEMSEDNWCVALLNRERFLLKVILKPPDLWMAHLKLLESIKDDSLVVNFQNSFRKAVITFRKPKLTNWKSLGSPLEGNNQLLDSRSIMVDDFCCVNIMEKENLTHDVILLGVKPVSAAYLHVPVGFHLKIRIPANPNLTRKYTPVKKSILGSQEENERDLLYFIIKIYPDGALTKSIGLLGIDSVLEMGAVAGKYDAAFLRNCDTLALFAGGTGITPFVKILDFLKCRSATYPISRVLLIFFNHTEDDIIWKDVWTNLTKSWSVFHFFPVISVDSKDWSGLKGRVNNTSLFATILNRVAGTDEAKSVPKLLGRFKAMVCGSSGFNHACVTMLKNSSVGIASPEEDIFVF